MPDFGILAKAGLPSRKRIAAQQAGQGQVGAALQGAGQIQQLQAAQFARQLMLQAQEYERSRQQFIAEQRAAQRPFLTGQAQTAMGQAQANLARTRAGTAGTQAGTVATQQGTQFAGELQPLRVQGVEVDIAGAQQRQAQGAEMQPLRLRGAELGIEGAEVDIAGARQAQEQASAMIGQQMLAAFLRNAATRQGIQQRGQLHGPQLEGARLGVSGERQRQAQAGVMGPLQAAALQQGISQDEQMFPQRLALALLNQQALSQNISQGAQMFGPQLAKAQLDVEGTQVGITGERQRQARAAELSPEQLLHQQLVNLLLEREATQPALDLTRNPLAASILGQVLPQYANTALAAAVDPNAAPGGFLGFIGDVSNKDRLAAETAQLRILTQMLQELMSGKDITAGAPAAPRVTKGSRTKVSSGRLFE